MPRSDAATRDAQPLEGWLKAIFAIAGVVGLVIGLLMFFVPADAGVGSAPPTEPPAGDQWWPWPLRTELNTRYVGSFIIGLGVASLWASRQTVWGQVRLFFPLTLVSHAFIIIALLLHTESFDAGDLETWLTYVLYPAAVLTGLFVFVRYELRGRADATATPAR